MTDTYTEIKNRLDSLNREIGKVTEGFKQLTENMSNQSGNTFCGGQAESPYQNLNTLFKDFEIPGNYADNLLAQQGALMRIKESSEDLYIKTIKYKDALKEINKSNISNLEKQEKIIDLQADLAKEAIEATTGLSVEATQKMRNDIDKWATDAKKAIKSTGAEFMDFLKNNKKAVEEGFKYAGEGLAKLLNSCNSDEKDRLEKEIKNLKDKYAKKKELRDKDMQEELFALGLVNAATSAQHEADLQKAIESGDQRAKDIACYNITHCITYSLIFSHAKTQRRKEKNNSIILSQRHRVHRGVHKGNSLNFIGLASQSFIGKISQVCEVSLLPGAA